MESRDYRYIARQALKGFWGISILVTIVAMLLGGVSGAGGASSGSNSRRNIGYTVNEVEQSIQDSQYGHNTREYQDYEYRDSAHTRNSIRTRVHNINGPLVIARSMALLMVSSVVFIIGIIFYLIGGFVELGYKLYMIKLVKKIEQSPFSTLFERANIFLKATGLRIVTGFFVFLWSLLLVIPGIIASYRYSMAPYIMAENPDIGIMEALNQSKMMMNGNKWRLFCLHFSFLGWKMLAVIVTFGLGLFVVKPYFYSAETAFYLDLTGQLNVRQPEEQAYFNQQ